MSAVRNSKAVVVLVYDESDVDDYDASCPRRRSLRRRHRFLAPRHSHSDGAVLTTTTTIVPRAAAAVMVD